MIELPKKFHKGWFTRFQGDSLKNARDGQSTGRQTQYVGRGIMSI